MTKAERESKPGRDISYCIDANYAKGTNTTLKSRRQLVMEVHTIAYSKSHRDSGVIQARGKIDDEANTLSTGDGCTNQSTGNYVFTKGEDMADIKFVGGVNPKKTWNKDDTRNLSRNFSQGERIHSPGGISPCISSNMGGTANGSTLITETDVSEIIQINNPKHSNDRVYNSEGISPTLNTMQGGNRQPFTSDVKGTDIRIRKLTPVECERLQGYPSGHTSIGRKPDGSTYEISNSQRYKMCGNGVSAPVPAYLFPKIFGNEPIRVMSLFSGCGGTELLLPSNFEVVGHCEFDKHASAVLNYHYPNIPNFHDVTEFVNKEVPEFDMLVGGFPCQSWSIAGLRKGFSDQRGQLIYNVFDILRKHKPKFLCLENVKGLLSKDGGDAFEAIMEYLSELGYELDFEVVNSKHFGLAQNRERVFIFGKLK